MSDAIRRSQAALDAYERQFALPAGTSSYRADPAVARTLINTLLSDLASYADLHQIRLDPGQIAALARPRTSPDPSQFAVPHVLGWEVDDAVKAIPRSGCLPPTRGYVAAIHHAADGSLECTVAFPGVPAPVRMQGTNVRATKPFPGVSLEDAEVTRPSEAMRRFVIASARRLYGNAGPRELIDEALLGAAISDWAGVSTARLRESLQRPIVRAAADLSASPMNAAQLAASDLPTSVFWSPTSAPAPPAGASAPPQPPSPHQSPRL
ncbi:hypothetical protein [Actinomadura gamaensis]|uniref:Uncharacterized protein n=1 Tax=Actinomadura gamaensis TaxID=1763541 RepID=A0ABV9TUR8_9ACTN